MHGKPTCLPCCTPLPHCCAWQPQLHGSPTYNCPLLPPWLQIHTLAIVSASLCGVVAVIATLIAFGLSAT